MSQHAEHWLGSRRLVRSIGNRNEACERVPHGEDSKRDHGLLFIVCFLLSLDRLFQLHIALDRRSRDDSMVEIAVELRLSDDVEKECVRTLTAGSSMCHAPQNLIMQVPLRRGTGILFRDRPRITRHASCQTCNCACLLVPWKRALVPYGRESAGLSRYVCVYQSVCDGD